MAQTLEAIPGRHVITHMPFLARSDTYKKEKPYGASFPVAHIPGATLTNHVFDILPVAIRDLRGTEGELNLEANGVCFLKAETGLRAEEASNSRTAEMLQYMEKIADVLQANFPEYSKVHVMDFQLRKRSPSFPDSHGARVEFSQPAALPHSDFTVKGALLRLEEEFPAQKEAYEGKDFDLINVWRVLKGPNDDWPLAVCDYASIDPEDDIEVNDVIHPGYIGENALLHHSPKHRWHYLSGMQEDDLLIFRNTDSSGKRSRCMHAAFHNPAAKGGPRQSVEVRVVAFRN